MLLDTLFYALEYYNELKEIEKIHLSNYAIEKVFQDGELKQIGFSYEDRNIPSIEGAREIADLINTLMPNKFVLIDTGDYITTDNASYDSETYDPYYRYYLVPIDVFNLNKEELFSIDHSWREEMKLLANSFTENINE